MIGICSECYEYTDTKDPCCSGGVWVDGVYVYPDYEDTEERAS
jgi:hypothetical protein